MNNLSFHLSLTGYVGGESFNSRLVRNVLNQYPGKHVDVLIDSFGGELSEGLSICGAFRDHGDVTVHFRGMNASAATIAAMGAKKISIAPEALYLVHKVSYEFFLWANKNADETEQLIKDFEAARDDLNTMDSAIAQLYASRCKKKSASDLLSLMERGAWLTAQDAKEWGFVDEIVDDPQNKSKAKISKAQACALEMSGLPLPPVPIESESKSIVQQIITSIKSIMSNPTAQMPQEPAENTQDQAGLDQNDNQTSDVPTPEQTESSSDPNAGNLENRLTSIEKTLAEIGAKIKNLAGAPAAASANVTASPTKPKDSIPESVDPLASYCKTSGAASKLFNSIP